jgi:branched-subunit amino acid aminotransferase/4-amino-4-deoxychorismate lyase
MGCKGSRVKISASRPILLPHPPVSTTPIRYCLDGRWLAPGEAAFAPTSGLVTAGEGWFETLRVEDGRPMFLEAHLDRLARSVAAGLGDPQAGYALLVVCRCLGAMQESFTEFPVGRLRLLLARDAAGEVWQALGEWGPQASSPASLADGIGAVTASFPHPGLGRLGKSASYHWSIAARREAVARGAGEALFLRDGRVLEGSTGSVAWLRDGIWRSSVSPDVLPSVTLAMLREAGIAIAADDLPADALHPGATHPVEGLVLVSALRLAVAIREVDGVSLPVDASRAASAEWRARLIARHVRDAEPTR